MSNREKIAMCACYILVFGALAAMVTACMAPAWMVAIAAQGGE